VTQLFDRKCVLIVGKPPGAALTGPLVEALRIEGLRCTFKIEKTLTKEPNKADVKVFNLSQASRARCQGKGIPIVLHAGYAGTVAQIFSGDCRQADSEKVGVDWETRFQCGDGERAYAFAHFSDSFRPGTMLKDVLVKVGKTLCTDPGNLLQAVTDIPNSFASGFVAHGPSASLMSQHMPDGYTWSVQNGRMEVLKSGATTADMGPLLSPNTGLVGTPAVGSPDKKGGPATWKVKCLLQPSVRPGQRIAVQRTETAPIEEFKVVKVVHTGDTNGGDFYSELEVVHL
jgi:hypothetical protein